jgi:outer membrane receptor protein involved in Fe transport
MLGRGWWGLVVGLLLSSVGNAQEGVPPDAGADAGAPAEAPPAYAEPEPAPEPGPSQDPAGPPQPAPPAPAAPSDIPPPAPSAPVAPLPEAPPPHAPQLEPPESADSETYGAVAVVPTPGRRLVLDKVPRNVQLIDRSVFDQDHPLGVHDALELRLGSVVLSDVQNNPLQPDLQYRGFTASPLLGTPQAIAVYQNGVRINDAFGEVVQWDLVPEFAVDEVQVMPGASPLYGQNALGAGIALQMKDGFRAPGHRISALTGSFGRYQASAEFGREFGEDWAVYGGVSAFGEQGFRDESQSSARHLFADVRQRGDEHEVGINATLADTDLNGNAVAPIELLEQRRAAVFTYPDNTQNRLLMIAADAKRDLTDTISLYGMAYLRHLERDTRNGDEGEFAQCQDVADLGLLCGEDEQPLLSEGGVPIAVPDQPYDGVYNTTSTLADGYGGTLQAGFDGDLLRKPNQFVFGGSYDGSAVAFQQRAELGRITADRSVAGSGTYLAGDEFRTKLEVDTRHAGVFAADTFTPVAGLALQLAARLNVSNLELTDRQSDALDGDHTFTRVNPAAGVAYTPIDPLTLFASYSESSRAPSAIELACADPEEPCRLPNAFVADPPLDQVVTRSVEVGVRGAHGGSRARPALSWSLAGFGSRNFDDIIFVAGSRIGTGYFRNAGETQRIGLEAGASAKAGPVAVYASYSLLRASFESVLELPGVANPGLEGAEEEEEEEGVVIEVEEGDRMPGLPTHSLKGGVTVTPIAGLDVGLTAIARSGSPFRGDEANLIEDVDGYVVLGAHASYWLLESLQLFVKAQNLLDTEYETFGLLAAPDEVLEGASNPRFYGPGAPFAVWAGLVVAGF